MNNNHEAVITLLLQATIYHTKREKIMNSEELAVLWIGAFRYYLGRQSIMTHAFCDQLTREFDSLPEQVKLVVVNDLKDAFKQDDKDRDKERDCFTLGSDADRGKWLDVLAVFSGL